MVNLGSKKKKNNKKKKELDLNL